MGSDDAVLRIERGRATEEELAALAVVLFSALAGRDEEDDPVRAPEGPRWRPERSAAAYRSPYHWQ
ncbi:acyl-CoA carboxylase subunit epsilon [Streptomyces sp. R21]|uniref:Acyl-CoA carboxylase subunit epsilon n=1 Tax=Streptomyces sp. R21 TaxID=3238627 RepID=A0AB39NZZ1_9ACTN